MRLRCVNGDTEIIIISPPEPDAVITCHGEPMVPIETGTGSREEKSDS
jgi:hypothetical protein